MKAKVILLAGSMAALTFLSACSGSTTSDDGDAAEPSLPKDDRPVTVTMAASNTQFTEEDFTRYIAEPVKAKYPHITVKRINTSDKGNSIGELLAAGTIPDLVGYYPGSLQNLKDNGMIYNIEELIQRHRFDTGRIIPEIVETIKTATDTDYLVGLPTYNNSFALFYNKDIFDRFGLPYPTDGMTWEEVKSLGAAMNRSMGGVDYRGLFVDNVYRGARQISLPYADFASNRSLLNTAPWQELFQYWLALYDQPGLPDNANNPLTYGRFEKMFLSGQLGMLAGYSNTLMKLRDVPDLNWDLVTYPQHPTAPGIGQRVDTPVLAISAQSEHKDAAFLVLDTMLSDEVQTEMARNGRTPVIDKRDVQDQYGKNFKQFEGKNVIAMTKLKYAVIAPVQYLSEGQADGFVNKAFESVANGQKDVNTALREADEQLNKHIAEQLARSK